MTKKNTLTATDDSFVYSLRYAIEPGFEEDDRLRSLVPFCQEARIDDVAFFVNCEELNRGHLTFDETEPWLKLIQRGKALLEPLGITTSINPWTTLLHCDRGRTLRDDQHFEPMVSPAGEQATAVACPLCPEWRRYLAEMYARYARLDPFILWVEDDFRLHNHDIAPWGGCFCDRHMAEFSRLAGKPLTRDEFVQGLLQPGPPHPYRKVWLDSGRDGMVSLARLIGKAVHDVSPGVRVGLMSSGPATHAAEGREWRRVLHGLSGKAAPMVNRPHLPSYVEIPSQTYLWAFNAVSRHTQACVPADTELYPELENFPQTRFAKSRSFSQFQVETSTWLGAAGITLNLFDMMGNGVLVKEGYAAGMAESKDFCCMLSKLGLTRDRQTGVAVLFDPDSSYTLQTWDGRSMNELCPAEMFWTGLLSCFGVTTRLVSRDVPHDTVVAVCGQVLRNYGRANLEDLFANNFVLLDGDAAHALLDMGHGDLAGVKSAEWLPPLQGFQAIEEVCNDQEYCGIRQARVSAQQHPGHYLNIQYLAMPSAISCVKDHEGKTLGPGMAVFENRVFVLPYGRLTGMPQCHLHPLRQEVLQSVFRDVKPYPSPAFVVDAPYVGLQTFDLGDREVAVLVNASGDDHESVRLHLPNPPTGPVLCLSRGKAKPEKIRLEPEGDDLVCPEALRRLEMKALVWMK